VDDLEQLRALILADEALQAQLGETENRAAFVDQAMEAARLRSIRLDAETLRIDLRPKSLAARRAARPAKLLPRPPPGWLPAQICGSGAQAWIDWAYFGARRLRDPAFEQSLQAALRRPLNALVRIATPLHALASRSGAPAPSGLIFHMSRCGSTLAAQMLAAIDRYIVVSEAAPIDQSVQIAAALSPPRIDGLKAMMEAFAPSRIGDDARYFIKLDCWHTLALPVFRQAFPAVPWVFLYRRPEEVMVSQLWRRGVQLIPDLVAPSVFGLERPSGAPTEDYWARVLAAICQPVIEAQTTPWAGRGGGLLVNYEELPQALWTRILPHFGVAPNTDEISRMTAAARYDAKAPQMAFVGDVEAKRSAVTDPVRIACERRLHSPYRRLEALRQRQGGVVMFPSRYPAAAAPSR
jgi:hypothetical protein